MATSTEGRNLVVCFDGTNNEFGSANTNVVRLFQALRDDSGRQVRYYDPGVGTISHPGAISRPAQKITMLFGLMFGLGATQNIIDAYLFLMRYYREGDRIYVFGFSRGALQARALAALLYRSGLLRPELETLAPYAVRMAQTAPSPKLSGEAKRTAQKDIDRISAEFTNTFSRKVSVYFLGLWDTVTSMGYITSPIAWPYTTNNPSVTIVRHAIALEERRSFFRQNRWAFGGSGKSEGQDFEERWFIGVHCDVGGGYIPQQSALWTVPMEWMVTEARKFGLQIDDAALAAPIAEARTECHDPTGALSDVHDSMKGLGPIWPIAEFVPKPHSTRDATGAFRRSWIWPPKDWLLKWLFAGGAMGRARSLKNNDRIHRSVLERFVSYPNYRPEPLMAIRMTVEKAKAFLATNEESYLVTEARD